MLWDLDIFLRHSSDGRRLEMMAEGCLVCATLLWMPPSSPHFMETVFTKGRLKMELR